ncbi:CHAP domain-containing protein [Nocardia sp. NPDC057227]|uniref:CHAP domain-containing protein n=1 Tax=Nocardia sp. NPDC057227 TaxID=3346056 RepID=UPI0036253378
MAAGPAQAHTLTCGTYGSAPSFGCLEFAGFSGQSTWGYPADGNGHNCTNYAAFRLAQNGVANPGNLGHAKDWDNNAGSSPVNNTPAKGSIAVWEAYSTPALEFGHVAYVDTVTGSGQSLRIETSEDNFNGTSMRRSIGVGDVEWPDHFIHFKDLSDSSTEQPARIATLGGDGHVYVKQGALNVTWSDIGGGFASVKMSRNRIAGVNNGQLLVKEGALNATWTVTTGAVDAYEVTDSRVGILVGGTLFVKDGPLNAVWTEIGSGFTSFKMWGNRIVGMNNGSLIAKEGPLNATWTTLSGPVDDYDVTEGRIGTLTGGVINVKVGPLNAQWTYVGAGFASFRLSPNRVAGMNGGSLIVKEGPLNAVWSTLTGNVDDYEVTDTRVGVLITGNVDVKEGPLNATWSRIGGGNAFTMS